MVVKSIQDYLRSAVDTVVREPQCLCADEVHWASDVGGVAMLQLRSGVSATLRSRPSQEFTFRSYCF